MADPPSCDGHTDIVRTWIPLFLYNPSWIVPCGRLIRPSFRILLPPAASEWHGISKVRRQDGPWVFSGRSGCYCPMLLGSGMLHVVFIGLSCIGNEKRFCRIEIDVDSSTPRQLWKPIDAMTGRGLLVVLRPSVRQQFSILYISLYISRGYYKNTTPLTTFILRGKWIFTLRKFSMHSRSFQDTEMICRVVRRSPNFRSISSACPRFRQQQIGLLQQSARRGWWSTSRWVSSSRCCERRPDWFYRRSSLIASPTTFETKYTGFRSCRKSRSNFVCLFSAACAVKPLHTSRRCSLLYQTVVRCDRIVRQLVVISSYREHSPRLSALVVLRSLDRLHGTHSQHTWKTKSCLP